MLLGFLSFIYFWVCVLIIVLVLMQKAKGSMGMSSQLGGKGQAILGSSGGQDIFQKTTWILGILLMSGSLGLAKYRSYLATSSSYIDANISYKDDSSSQENNK